MTKLRIERANARTTDPETSHVAAAGISDLIKNQRAVLLVLRRYGPATHEELVHRYNMVLNNGGIEGFPRQSASGIRTRCKELVKAGMAENTGDKRRISTGGLSIIWRAC